MTVLLASLSPREYQCSVDNFNAILVLQMKQAARLSTTQAAAYWIFIVGFHSTLGHLKYSALDYSWSDRETEAFPALAKNRFNLQDWAEPAGGEGQVLKFYLETRQTSLHTQRTTDGRIKCSLAKLISCFMIFQPPKDQIK